MPLIIRREIHRKGTDKSIPTICCILKNVGFRFTQHNLSGYPTESFLSFDAMNVSVFFNVIGSESDICSTFTLCL